MKQVLFIYNDQLESHKRAFLDELMTGLSGLDYVILNATDLEIAREMVLANARICGIVFDWNHYDLEPFHELDNYNPDLPVFAVGETHNDLDLDSRDLVLNIDFIQYDAILAKEDIIRIDRAIENYFNIILPPFTRQLMHYVSENNYSFCTPGHQQGYGFQRSPIGAAFYDFYGPNIFKSDISISMSEMGSLLDHSGPHQSAEEYIAETFGADRSLMVINGTSTSNKIVSMYAAADGDTVLIDRNCHKSLAHMMMMVDVNPIYLKPTRNAYGIIGAIPKSEFTRESIQAKLDAHPTTKDWPVYAVITNSTYDGIFYNVDTIHELLEVKQLHFDSAWVPYTNFHPIYAHKYGMGITPKAGHTIFETQSTHKLLAAFSQASMIHVKGDYNDERLNEAFMMHTSTSPFYPIVASCEISAAMMKGKLGKRLINECIEYAMDFRREVVKLNRQCDSWYYDIWQPENIDETDAWTIEPKASWHGFKKVDENFLYLDPVKVTVLLPGIKDNQLEESGIPASIVSAFLEDHGIIVEKTGPYSMLFLFSVGITKAKSMRLLAVLNKFKVMYDDNAYVRDVLPSIYAEHPEFYRNMRIQEVAKIQHQLIKKHNLPDVMYHAYDVLPQFEMTPHKAYQHLVKDKVKKIPLENLQGHTSAVMVLPYPPGIPLIMPGESIHKDSKVILDFLLMLEEIGKVLPGFDYDIHGVEKGEDGQTYIKVLDI